MNIWLITVGEPLPTDDDNSRLYRTGILAKMLNRKGHKVTWWTSNVNHVTKRQRYLDDKTIHLHDNYQIKLIHSVNYRKNVSLSRIFNHYFTARKFSKMVLDELEPDIILCSLPTLSLSMKAVKYGKKRGIPVVLDIRDLWPDIFLNIFPGWAEMGMKFILSPAFKMAYTACKDATAIMGITSAFVEWGQMLGDRQHTDIDRDFPLAYSEKIPSQDLICKAREFWEEKGINNKNGEFIACFFGTMGRQFDLEPVIKVAKTFQSVNKNIKLVLCGSGDNLKYYKDLASDCSNIIFPGWVQAHHIWTLMKLSSVGLAPYYSSNDFMKSYPNKSIEYLSAGLPIVSSLKGLLQELLESNSCGITYENGNAEQLAEILTRLYEEPETLKKMSENALSLYRERFVAEKVYSDMIDHLELICSEYNKGGE
ncbi:MAG TPA: glycosyltransferase WbuB [Syntrophomonas sp.]|jgi:glycosyltransferase involved in cell wall biosynthesis|nr:glycosyltransferase WbuB [Syntrophomonas sp.]